MSVKVDRLPGRLRAAEVRDGRGHLVEEGHVLPKRTPSEAARIAWGNRVFSVGLMRDMIRAELALLACAEELDARRP